MQIYFLYCVKLSISFDFDFTFENYICSRGREGMVMHDGCLNWVINKRAACLNYAQRQIKKVKLQNSKPFSNKEILNHLDIGKVHISHIK